MKHIFFVINLLLLCIALVGCSDLIGDESEVTRTLSSDRTDSLEDEKRGTEITDPLWLQNVIGKKWYLTELRQTEVVDIASYQDIQPIEGVFLFTLNFSVEGVNGVGYVNHFFGPYTLGNGQALFINELAVTLMAPINEPEGLKEDDYFNYLVNAYRWNLAEGSLELISSGDDRKEVVLVFAVLEGSDDS